MSLLAVESVVHIRLDPDGALLEAAFVLLRLALELVHRAVALSLSATVAQVRVIQVAVLIVRGVVVHRAFPPRRSIWWCHHSYRPSATLGQPLLWSGLCT